MKYAIGTPGQPVRLVLSREAAAERNRQPGEVIVPNAREKPGTISADGLSVVYAEEPGADA